MREPAAFIKRRLLASSLHVSTYDELAVLHSPFCAHGKLVSLASLHVSAYSELAVRRIKLFTLQHRYVYVC